MDHLFWLIYLDNVSLSVSPSSDSNSISASDSHVCNNFSFTYILFLSIIRDCKICRNTNRVTKLLGQTCTVLIDCGMCHYEQISITLCFSLSLIESFVNCNRSIMRDLCWNNQVIVEARHVVKELWQGSCELLKEEGRKRTKMSQLIGIESEVITKIAIFSL